MFKIIVLSISILALVSCSSDAVHRDYFSNSQIAPIAVRVDLSEELLSNKEDFESDFFKQFPLKHDATPLQLSSVISKSYLFPTLFDNVTMAVAMYFCSFDEVAKLMPNSLMRPVSMGRGRALIIFSSYQYNKVLGMHPYREIAVSVPVLVNQKEAAPIYPLLAGDYPGLGFYVLAMPETTLENKIRGRTIWGYPKLVEKIDLKVDDGAYSSAAIDAYGEKYLEFSIPFSGEEKFVRQKIVSYSVLNGKIQKSHVQNEGVFLTRRFLSTLVFKDKKVDREYLHLGNNPLASMLKQLKIEKHPFQFQFGKSIASASGLPDAVPVVINSGD